MKPFTRLKRLAGGAGVALAVAIVVTPGCTGQVKQAGGLEIIVSTDMPTPERFDTVHIEIAQQAPGGGWRVPLSLGEYRAIPDEIRLPTTISVAAGQSPYQEVQITITGLRGGVSGQEVVQRVVQTQVPTDRLAELAMVLASVCAGNLNCPVGDSCQPLQVGAAGAGACGPNVVEAVSLPAYNPSDVDEAGVSSLDSSAPEATVGGKEAGAATDSGAVPPDATTALDGSPTGDGAHTGDATDDVTRVIDSGAPDGAPDGAVDAGSDAPPCTDACVLSQTKCLVGSVQTCQAQPRGCTDWVTTSTCGAHQTCATESSGTVSCRCSATLCTESGAVCQDAQTVATCAKDGDACLYVASTASCTAPMFCSGASPIAGCSLTCTNSCKQGQTSCVAGGLATCTLSVNGCWAYAAPVACGNHESCTGSAGAAACTCNVDPVCSTAGQTCESSTTLAVCAADAQGCIYETKSAPCSNGACNAGACCTNRCNPGETNCAGGLATCTQLPNGCWAYAPPVACGSHQTCTGATGSGKCTCNADPVCTSAGNLCTSTTSSATCSLDADRCVYESAATACKNQTCVGGSCAGVCGPTDTKCAPDGIGLESCAADGTWSRPTACAFACVNGACGGSCKPGTLICANRNTANQTCDGTGQWAPPVACPVTNPACSNGHCAYDLPNNGVMPNTNQQNNNFLYAVRVTPTTTTRVARVGFVGGGAAGNISFGIYDDRGGFPNSTLGSSSPLSNAVGNVEGIISPSVTLSAQTSYWIVGLSDSIFTLNANISAGPGYLFQNWGSTSLPQTFPTGGALVTSTAINYYLVVQDP